MHGHNEDFDKAEKSFDLAQKILQTHIAGTREHINLLLARATNLQQAKRWEEAIPIWKKLDTLTVEDDSIEKPFRTAIIEGLVESYTATNQPELAEQYSTELEN